ncbi:MAG: hypothetical protein K6A80_08425, partial [Saccharofermentans sp.]|nr:hypothetical protein [Saccharofermentans sp.]
APTTPGDYVVRVTVPATELYNEITATDTFAISKGTVTATVSVPDTIYGESYTPTLTTDSDGADRAVYEYKADGAADSTYTTTAPTAPGDYIVRVTVPETDLYNEVTATDSFTIGKGTATASISVPDSFVGDTYTPTTSTTSDGAASAVIEYKVQGADDRTYTTTQPTAAGDYTARYTVPATDTYNEVSATDDFTISRKTATASVSVSDTVYGESYTPVLTTDSDGADRAVYEYKVSGADDSTFTTTAPILPGDYIVRVTVPQTDTYNEVSAADSFTIGKGTAPATVTVPDTVYGESYTPTLTTDSDGAERVVYEYKVNGAADSTYTTTAPTMPGEYVVRATVPETDLYNEVSATGSFTISKVTVTATVSVPDTSYGETYTPTLSTESDGADRAVYEYKVNGAADSTYTTTAPTVPGEYIVRVTVPETDIYNEVSATDGFTISKGTVTATVSVPDTSYGETYSPTLTTVSDGADRAVYEYKVDGAADSTYTTTSPTVPGDYIVRVTVPETDLYNEVSATDSFTIDKAAATATITVPDSYVGDTYTPVTSTNSDGAARGLIEYKIQGAEDWTYTTGQPFVLGAFTARYTVPETDNYYGIVVTDDFTISRRTATASVSVPDTVYGESYSPTLTTDSDGADRAVYEYKVPGAADNTFTTTAPTMPGDYIVRVTIPQTDNYNEVSATDSFTISKKTPTLTFTVSNSYVGTTYSPSVTTDSNMASSAVIEYKEKAAPDTDYTTTKPTTYGEYIARVIVPASEIYFATSAETEFKISYLESPENAFNFEGTEGNNGYYTSEVELKAPEGYQISSSYNGTYSDSIQYNENIRNIYLKRSSDGALTAAIALSNRPKIDMAAPEITSASGSIENGSIHYAQNFEFSATDPNLKYLKINDEVIDLSTLVGNKITLTAGYGMKIFTIIAEDEAGNISKVRFTLMAEWLRNRIIPADLKLPLMVEEIYMLDEGEWTVNDDETVYNGGGEVYVRANADYTFTRVG